MQIMFNKLENKRKFELNTHTKVKRRLECWQRINSNDYNHGLARPDCWQDSGMYCLTDGLCSFRKD